MRIAGVEVRKHRRVDVVCPKCGQPSVYSFAPRTIPAPGLYGRGRRVGGRTQWVVACDSCRPTMSIATGTTEEDAIEAFKKHAADRKKRGS